MLKFFHSLGSPKFFYTQARRILPYVWILALLCLIAGLIGGLYISPPDYVQGNVFRIIYIHVPAAILSMNIYGALTIFAIIGIIWRIKLMALFIKAGAPIGASMTAIALITGAIWGKPTWGTFWIWDARLTSELILLFIYAGYMLLYHSFDDKLLAQKVTYFFIVVGAINLPIIHYSVVWWNTLHQGASLNLLGHSSISPVMLYPLIAMIIGFFLLCFALGLMRACNEILIAEKNSKWVSETQQ
jgi:heme exporter protein C